jgi:hypothetical protein
MNNRCAARLRPAGLAVLVTVASCGAWNGGPERDGDGIGIAGEAGATVITGEELHAATGSVLRALLGKVPNMKVDQAVGRCPSITFRASRDLHGFNYPDVYLDGTRASNTCILETLPASDAERVEVYPQGVTTRPGYRGSNQGLILIFSRRGA